MTSASDSPKCAGRPSRASTCCIDRHPTAEGDAFAHGEPVEDVDRLRVGLSGNFAGRGDEDGIHQRPTLVPMIVFRMRFARRGSLRSSSTSAARTSPCPVTRESELGGGVVAPLFEITVGGQRQVHRPAH